MEERLKAHIIGQDEAVKAVSRAIRRVPSAARNPTRPLASFLFSGPIGVGKTTLATALAIEFCGCHESLIRFDMRDHVPKH